MEHRARELCRPDGGVLSAAGWVSKPAPQVAPAETVPVARERLGAFTPHLGVPAPETVFPLATVAGGDWVMGVHGGSGERQLAAALGVHPSGHQWPTGNAGPARALLVARTDMRGVFAMQQALRQWASGMVPGVTLMGVVWSADAPGKLPKALRDQTRIVGGGAPRMWVLPWVECWRLEAAEPLSSSVASVLTQIRSTMKKEESQ